MAMEPQDIKQALLAQEEVEQEQLAALEGLDEWLVYLLDMLPPLPPALRAQMELDAALPPPAPSEPAPAPAQGAPDAAPPTPQPDSATASPAAAATAPMVTDEAPKEVDARARTFTAKFLPSIVRILLKRRVAGAEARPAALAALAHVAELVARSLLCAPGWDESAELLEALLNDDARFYAAPTRFFFGAGAAQGAAEGDEPGAAQQQEEALLAPFVWQAPYSRHGLDLLQVVASFARAGGYHVLLARLRARALSVARLVALLKPLAALRKALRPPFAARWAAALLAAVRELLMAASEAELRALDVKKDVPDLLELLESLLRAGSAAPDAGAQAAEQCERLQLDLALKCLRSSVLEKRLWALATVSASLSMAARPDAAHEPASAFRWATVGAQRLAPGAAPYARSVQALDAGWLGRWLLEQRVLDEVFGPRAHPELLRRAPDLLRFLAAGGLLTAPVLQLVWGAAAAGESTAIGIYRLLEEVAPALAADHIALLLGAVAAPDAAKLLDLPALEALVCALTRVALALPPPDPVPSPSPSPVPADPAAPTPAPPAAPESPAVPGLQLLYRIVQGGAGETAAAAFRHLAELLASAPGAPHREPFMRLCLDAVRSRRSPAAVSVALDLLQRMLAAYPNPAPGSAPEAGEEQRTVGAVIAALEQQHGLLGAVLAEVQASAAALSVEQLRSRLGFLRFVCARSALKLRPPDLDALCLAFLRPPAPPALADALLEWLTASCGDPAVFGADAGAGAQAQAVFARLAALDPARLSAAGLRCLERYLRLAAHLAGALAAPWEPVARSRPARSLALPGLDALWAAALDAREPAVARAAADFLIGLYIAAADSPPAPAPGPGPGPGPGASPSPAAAFLAAAMGRLASALGGLPGTEGRVARSVELLAAYVHAWQQRAQVRRALAAHAASSASASAGGDAIRLSLKLHGYSQERTFYLAVRARDTVGEVRERLAGRLGQAGTQLMVCERVLEAGLDGEALEDLAIEESRDVVLLLPPSLSPDAAAALLDRPDPNAPAPAPAPAPASAPPTLAPAADGPAAMSPELAAPVSAAAPGAAAAEEAVPADEDPAQLLVASDAYFDLLFAALTCPPAAAKAWALVTQTLPLNPRLYAALAGAGPETAAQWAQLLPGAQPLKLLYSLQIVDSLLAAPAPQADAWTARFRAHGGLAHLHAVFLTPGAPPPPDTLAMLLRILARFLLVPPPPAPAPAPAASSSTTVPIGPAPPPAPAPPPSSPSAPDAKAAAAAPAPLPELQSGALESEAVGDALLVRAMQVAPLEGGAGAVPLLAALLAQPARLQRFYALPQLEPFLRAALVEPRDAALGAAVRAALSGLVRRAGGLALGAVPPPQAVLLPLLLSQVPSVGPQNATCLPFFELLAELLPAPTPAPAPPSVSPSPSPPAPLSPSPPAALPVPLAELIRQLVARLTAHPPVEATDAPGREDAVAQGLMVLLRAALQAGQGQDQGQATRALLPVLWAGLFEAPTAASHGPGAPPRFKRYATRAAAYALLQGAAAGDGAVLGAVLERALAEQLTDQRVPPVSEWDYVPEARAALGYVGLRNLGCTCYMNSLLQQLFMMPRFRRGLLAVDYYPPPDKDHPRREDGLLYQLQATFAALHESERLCYDPARFVAAAGADPAVQMDVDEFFNTVCDRVDEPLKRTPHAALLKQLWRGTLKSQLLGRGQGCAHASERDEDFYALALDIKGKASILEALALYVQGEVLQGDDAYRCEPCGQRVATLKRTVLGQLPDTLILHLKRFEFNFDTMRKLKLNDQCEFPEELDMYPYTKEGLMANEGRPEDAAALTQPAPYYQYRLAGILVHRGVADSGHYYSYIKERGLRPGQARPQWLEFNDEIVRAFDPRDIPEECFGGLDTSLDRLRPAALASAGPQLKTRSAYMLIYERAQPLNAAPPQAAPATPEPAAAPAAAAGPAAGGAVRAEGVSYVTSYCIGRQERPPAGAGPEANEAQAVAIPRPMYDEVWKDNARFGLDRHVWDPAYCAFVAQLLRTHLPAVVPVLTRDAPWAADRGLGRRLVELAGRFFLDVVLRGRDRSMARPVLLPLLQQLMPQHLPGCRWLMDRVCQPELYSAWTLAEMALLDCRSAEARQLFVDLVVLVLRSLQPHEAALLAPPVRRRRRRSRADSGSGGSSDEWASDSDEQAQAEASDGEEDTEDERPPARGDIDAEEAAAARLIRRLMAFAQQTPLYRYWRVFGQYFEVFARVAEMGPAERRFLIEQGAVQLLADCYLHDESPLRKKKTKARMGDRYDQPNFYWLVQCLERLLTSCLPWHDATPAPPTLLPGGPLRLSPNDELLVTDEAFWAKLVREGGNNAEATVRLLQHYQFQHQRHSELVLKVLRDALNEAEPERLAWLGRVATGVLDAPEDDFQEPRARWLLDDMLNRLADRRSSGLLATRRYVQEGIRALRAMSAESELVRNSLAQVPSRLAWMDAWLRSEDYYRV